MPDYPNGKVFLAYSVQFKNGSIIYVNAVNGDIIGKDQTK